MKSLLEEGTPGLPLESEFGGQNRHGCLLRHDCRRNWVRLYL